MPFNLWYKNFSVSDLKQAKENINCAINHIKENIGQEKGKVPVVPQDAINQLENWQSTLEFVIQGIEVYCVDTDEQVEEQEIEIREELVVL